MFFSHRTDDAHFNAKMDSWRWGTRFWYFMSLLFVIATPVIAGEIQKFVPSEVVENWLARYSFGGWVFTYVAIFILTFIFVEVMAHYFVSEGKKEYPTYIDDIVRKLSKKAGFAEAPRVVYHPKSEITNAGAFRSLSYGRKIILMGDIKKLSLQELEAVVAHEVGHLMMRDVRFGQLIKALLAAARIVNIFLFLALVCSVFARIFVSYGGELTWYLLTTFLVMGIGIRVARLCHLRYSRLCEYRADALAIQLTSKEHRLHLIGALKKVRELGFLVLLKKHEKEEIDINKSHPTIKKRARALGLMKFFRRFAT